MRGTYFIVHVNDFPLIYQATRESDVKLRILGNWGINEREYYRVSEEILKILEHGGKMLREIMYDFPANLKRTVHRTVGRREYLATNVSVVLSLLESRGRLFHKRMRGHGRLSNQIGTS